MNPRIQYLIDHPFEVELTDVPLLQEEIDKYPYYSVLRTLLLFGLKEYEHATYKEELKKTSIYCPSRVALFHYLQKEKQKPSETDLNEDAIIEEKPELNSEIPTPIVAGLEETLKIHEENSHKESEKETPEKEEMIPPKEGEIIIRQNAEESAIEEKPVETKPEETSKLKEDSEFTFSQWLNFSENPESKPESHSVQPDVERKEVFTPQKLSERDIKYRLIDEFIEKSPKIAPLNKEDRPAPKKSDTTPEYTDLMTETLAHIYTEQKKYDKAITAYKILGLKYPDKKDFFQSKIHEIEELKNQ